MAQKQLVRVVGNALKMWTGWPTFPMVFVKGTLVGGASELQALIESDELKKMLVANQLITPRLPLARIAAECRVARWTSLTGHSMRMTSAAAVAGSQRPDRPVHGRMTVTELGQLPARRSIKSRKRTPLGTRRVLERLQVRLDRRPQQTTVRRRTVEHVFDPLGRLALVFVRTA